MESEDNANKPSMNESATPLDRQLLELGLWNAGQPLKLHLGCGELRLPSYVNIDLPPSSHTSQTRVVADAFGDITKLAFSSGTIDEIRLHHVFEHFDRPAALALLVRWTQALKLHGQLILETPDFLACARLVASDTPFEIKEKVIRHVFGSHEAAWAYHLEGWYPEKFKRLLNLFGFDAQIRAASATNIPLIPNLYVVANKSEEIVRERLLEHAEKWLDHYLLDATEQRHKDFWVKRLHSSLQDSSAVLSRSKTISMSTLGSNGRFGNQLFQYAFLRMYAMKHGLRVETPDWVGRKLFGHDDAAPSGDYPRIKDLAVAASESRILSSPSLMADTDIEGFFQFHTSFHAPHKEFFRRLCKPVAPIESALVEAMRGFRGRTIIAIHLRRTDYGYKEFFIAPNDLYKKWIEQIWNQVSEPLLYVASDDLDSVVGDFSIFKPVTRRDLNANNQIPDFYLDHYALSHAQFLAISNSTFSFSASMLNEKANAVFVRPVLAGTGLIPFDPWDSDVLIRDSICLTRVNEPANAEGSNLVASPLERIVGPEIKDDALYNAVLALAQRNDVRTVLEIGSSSGQGSTEALMRGLVAKSSQSKLFCIEISKPRFSLLQSTYGQHSFIEFHNVSSVPVGSFLSANEVSNYYRNIQPRQSMHYLDRALTWLGDDLNYVRRSGVDQNGIERIKRENRIAHFDLVLIDGSAFTARAELDLVYGARFIALDDINDIKNYHNYSRLTRDSNYRLYAEDKTLRNGYAIFERVSSANIGTLGDPQECTSSSGEALPINFFTIVLNGEPFIRYHISMLERLPFPWHWHIVEGVADLKRDTAWSVPQGGRIPAGSHASGLSVDGTTQYIDSIKQSHSSRISVYRKSHGGFWDGKLEMVSAPFANINQECLLWQLDSDELWTPSQVVMARQMFLAQPEKTAAFYRCRYYVGPKLFIATNGTYGNNPGEWLRTWRFKPGCKWLSHEPPVLCSAANGKPPVNIASVDPFSIDDTKSQGLVFQHFAYATESQVRFKEDYYGYAGAVDQWKSLQAASEFPLRLSSALSWVRDKAEVVQDAATAPPPLASIQSNGTWQFRNCVETSEDKQRLATPQRIVWLRPDAIGDAVLAASMLPHIRRRYPDAHITVVCDDRTSALYTVCPFVDGVLSFNRKRILSDNAYGQEFATALSHLRSDLCLNSVFSPEPLTEFLAIACGARNAVAFDGQTEHFPPELNAQRQRIYSRFVENGTEHTTELERHRSFLAVNGVDAPKLLPVLWTRQEDESLAIDIFRNNGIDPSNAIVLFAGAQSEKRLYARYGEALREVCRENALSVIALGSKVDENANQANLKGIGQQSVDLSGKTSLTVAAEIIRRCRLAVGAETGLAHIACAVGTPNVILLGGGHFGRFMPYSPLTSVVCLPLDCYGCNWQCRYSAAHCVKDVEPSVLSRAINDALQGVSAKTRVYFQSDWQSPASGPRFQPSSASLANAEIELIEVNTISGQLQAETARQSAVQGQCSTSSGSVTCSRPLISLIVITNAGNPGQEKRAKYLERLIASMRVAGLPAENTQVIISGAAPENVKVAATVQLPDLAASGQVCRLRNEALKLATGDLVIHCDDDVVFAQGYWQHVVKRLDEDWDILCTRLLNPNGTRYWDWAAHHPGKGQTLLPYNATDPFMYATGGHAIYRKKAFDSIRWNEAIRHGGNEEFDLAAQARQHRMKFTVCPSATVFLQYHHCDAQAVIERRPQAPDTPCAEFTQTLNALDGSQPVYAANISSNRSPVHSRFAHKLRPRPAGIDVSILVGCYRYLRRFKVFADSILRQDFPLRRIELIVGNPNSPDGLAEYLTELESKGNKTNGPSVKQVMIDAAHHRNRGLMIQKAFEHSTGTVVIGMDCDLVLPSGFIRSIVDCVNTRRDSVVGVYRNFLAPETTESILTGRVDPSQKYEELLQEDCQEQDGYRGVLGYCQAALREHWMKVGYPTEFDNIAKSDVAFVERLGKIGVTPLFLKDLRVLHLHHPRDWSGTTDFL